MKTYKINSQVVIFDHSEYGKRLLFKNGITNPRDMLGKNGVTIHNSFTAVFYKTIHIQAMMLDELGNEKEEEFYINKNSLIKYLGSNAASNDSDEELINKLKGFLSNNDEINPNADSKKGLRHAGHHNQRPINSISDSLKGSFFSWLYQNTITGINRIKIRFFLLGKEKDIFEAGEILATKRFHEAAQAVPAYKKYIEKYGLFPADFTFNDIPTTNKEDYIKKQKYDNKTHFNGEYPKGYKKDTSTGTTGKPTSWIRGPKEVETVKKSLELASKIQFADRRLNYVNAFALGPWATGLTTQELMRNTGSVFATGADKDKILNHLIEHAHYEKNQLKHAVKIFMAKYPTIETELGEEITTIIDIVLKLMLKKRDAKFADIWNEVSQSILVQSNEKLKLLMHQYGSEIKVIAEKLNLNTAQLVIAGYPPFLKDLADYTQSKGYNFSDFSAIGVVGGQAISEASRDQLIKHGFNQIYSFYGASDLDINLGVETEYEITVRKALEQNPKLAKELYGENKGLPMVFHYDPMNYHIECNNEDSLVFTCTRNDRSSPRIRYDLGDKGRLYASSDIQAVMAKYGIYQKPKTNLPLMFVWGRDSTVIFNGANLAFTELERAIVDSPELERIVLKKAFYTYSDADGNEKLEIWLELNDAVELPNERKMNYLAQALLNKLADANQDFRYQIEKLDTNVPLPMIRFFKRGQSPISEAGGHRKQVLIFQKNINLANDYQFPPEECCKGICVPKTDKIASIQI